VLYAGSGVTPNMKILPTGEGIWAYDTSNGGIPFEPKTGNALNSGTEGCIQYWEGLGGWLCGEMAVRFLAQS
jgi:hypothetical protein